jgi:hypothetical protein
MYYLCCNSYDTKNKVDDEFINNLLPCYGNLATIFENIVATWQFVRTSKESLCVEVSDNSPKGEINIGGHLVLSVRPWHLQVTKHPREQKRMHSRMMRIQLMTWFKQLTVASSDNRPSKRVKKNAFKNDENSVDGLIQPIDHDTQTLATLADAIEEAVLAKTTKKALSDDLFEEVDNLPDFEFENKSEYYTHLVTNLDIATVFMSLSFLYKITWVTSFVNERC